MSVKVELKRWRDSDGNVYGVEKTVRNGRFAVIRTNPGGNRKAAKQFHVIAGNAGFMQETLDNYAVANGWTEVTP